MKRPIRISSEGAAPMNGRIGYTIAPWDREDNMSRTLVRLVTQSTNDGIWDWNLETDEVYYSGLRLTVSPTGLATQSDQQLLGRILRNLISNAIKYTDHGRILIG